MAGLFAIVVVAGAPASGGAQLHPMETYAEHYDPMSRFGTADSTKDARKITAKFASCVVGKYDKAVKESLALPFYDLKNWGSLKKVMNPTCARTSGVSLLSMPPMVFRGALYEALYQRDFGNMVGENAVGTAHPHYPENAADEGAKRHDEVTEGYRKFMTIGECVVRADPVTARQLVLSKVETPEETAAVAKIAALIPICTTESMRLSRSILRMMIAEPLYRMTSPAAAHTVPASQDSVHAQG